MNVEFISASLIFFTVNDLLRFHGMDLNILYYRVNSPLKPTNTVEIQKYIFEFVVNILTGQNT